GMWEPVFVGLQLEPAELPLVYLRGGMWIEKGQIKTPRERQKHGQSLEGNSVNTEHSKFILHHS
ncbi:hypothetical protein ACQP3F_26010, partial [Escherichia coli]